MAYRSSYNVCIEGGTDGMVYRLLVSVYNEGGYEWFTSNYSIRISGQGNQCLSELL